MPATKKKARKPVDRMPSDAGRNVIRRQMSALPAEWAEIDALAARLARPGYPANLSGTLRECVRAVLNAEALGLLTIGEGGIRIVADRRPTRGDER